MGDQISSGIAKAVATILIIFALAVAAITLIDLVIWLICEAVDADYEFGEILRYSMSFTLSLIPFIFYNVGFILLILYDYTIGWLIRWGADPPGRDYLPPTIPIPGMIASLPVFFGEGKKKIRSFFRPQEQINELYICEV